MILSSPCSQTQTLATANIQFQNSIMLITHDNIGLRKDLFCALTNGQTGCSARRISALYVSLKGPSSRFLRDRHQEINIYQPPHKYIMDKWQWVIIPISLRNRCSYHVNDKSQLPGSALQSVVERSELRSWAGRAPAPVAAPYSASAVVSGPLVQCTLIHFHSSQHSTAPLSLPSFILSTYTLIHL